MKRLTKLLLLPLIALTLSSCSFLDFMKDFVDGGGQTAIIPVTGITLSKTSATLEVGEYLQLTATVRPINASNKDVTWSSSNSTIAVVTSSGNVKANSKGTATITVTSKSDTSITATCRITVNESTEPGPGPEPGEVPTVNPKYTYKDYINNNVYNLSSCPSVGEAKLLVIPVWFTDSSNYVNTSKKDTVKGDIQKAYFGSESETGWHSVKSYYEAESFGKLSLSGFVTDWYNAGKASTYYSSSSATCSLVKSAVSWYKSQYSVTNMRDFDKDEDGWVDGVMLIYAAPDYATRNQIDNIDVTTNLWAYCYWLQEGQAVIGNPNTNVFFWASYDFMYSSGSFANNKTGHQYGAGDTSHCLIDAHTYIHEMGHVFGLEDYYDYNRSYNDNRSPAASFSMQDWNVGAHDPYSRFALGWVTPYMPSSTATFTVRSMEDYGECVLLPYYTKPDASPFDEYILLELFTPSGLNQHDCSYNYSGLPTGPGTAGVRIWHVDARLITSNGYETTNAKANGGVTHGATNTSYSSSDEDGRSKEYLGSYDYDLLHLIRNYNTSTNDSTFLNSNMLFKTNDTFSISDSKFASQFPNNGKLDSEKSFKWTVTFNSVSSTSMNITVTKA